MSPASLASERLAFDRIFSSLPELHPALLDSTVTEIMVNAGGKTVFLERNGIIEETNFSLNPLALENAIQKIARIGNRDVAEEQPLLEARLEDGSRVAAMLPPCAVDGPTMTIRKFGERYTLAQLVARKSLPGPVAAKLTAAIRGRQNILISGGTGCGKTTFLNAVANQILDKERILLIESTSEIKINQPNLVRCEARPPEFRLNTAQDAVAEVTIAHLVAFALRMRPDRIIVGEVRGLEAWDVIQALNTGHRGSLSTIHANSAEEALVRLGELSEKGLPATHVKVARLLDIVVQLARATAGHRYVAQVVAVKRYDAVTDTFETQTLYESPLYAAEARASAEAVWMEDGL
jgi:pilus assembly protein CpaF